MARNLENSTSENSNIQEMGPRRSTMLNVTISGAAPPLRGSTMATTAVATKATTSGEVHGTKATAKAMSFQAQGKLAPCRPNPTRAKCIAKPTQASHSRAPHVEQPTPVAQPAPAEHPTLVAQPVPPFHPTPVAQPASSEQPTLVT